LDRVVLLLVVLVGLLLDVSREVLEPRSGRLVGGRRVVEGGTRDRAAVTAVREHDDPDAGGERAPHRVELVVDELPVVEHPRLVVAVPVVVAVEVGHLSAVAGVGEEEDVAGAERLRRGADLPHDVLRPRGLGQQHGAREPLALGDRLHVVGVELAPGQIATPATVVVGIDPVESDVERASVRRLHH
jgi:hypothetical protein